MTRKFLKLRNVAATVACLAAAMTMFQGCKTDEPTPKNITVTDGQTNQTVYANENSGSDGVSFTTTGAWASRITESTTAQAPAEAGISRAPGDTPDWISINPDHGDAAGTYTITITLLPNETGVNRTATIIISCDGTEVTITVTQKGETNGVEPVELKSPITTNTTLKDLGIAVDYYFNGTNSLTVQDNAMLTIEPGVTIQFRNGGALYMWTGTTLNAVGIAAKPIQFIGPTDNAGSWKGIEINAENTHTLSYVQILNAGASSYANSALCVDDGKVAMTNCLIKNSLLYGINFGSGSGNYRSEFTQFSNNTITGCGKAPIGTISYGNCSSLRNIDNTNTFTGNGNEYIYVPNQGYMVGDFTLHSLNGYPWYFENGIWFDSNQNITIEAGATILMGADTYIDTQDGSSHFIVNGTADKHITIKGFKDGAGYWRDIEIYSQTPGSKLNYCDISGGGGSYNKCLLYVNSGAGAGGDAYLEINNTKLSNSLHYGMNLNAYNAAWVTCLITSSNSASVTFSNCPDGNIYSNGCLDAHGNPYWAVYNTLAETCNMH